MAQPTSLLCFLQLIHPQISPSSNRPPLSPSTELHRQFSAAQVATLALSPHPLASAISSPHSGAHYTYPFRFPDEGFGSDTCADSNHDADAHGHECDDVDCVHPHASSYANALLGGGESPYLPHEAKLHASHVDRGMDAGNCSDDYRLSNNVTKLHSDERHEVDCVHLNANSHANVIAYYLHHEAELHADEGYFAYAHDVDRHMDACTSSDDYTVAKSHSDDGYAANVRYHTAENFDYSHCDSRDDCDSGYAYGGPCDHPQGDSNDPCKNQSGKHGSFTSSDSMNRVHLFETPLSSCSSTGSTLTIAEAQDSRSSAQADENEGPFEIDQTAGVKLMENLCQTEYFALDACGQAPSHLSSTWPQSKFSKFKSWQDGDWQWRVLSKPHNSPSPPWGLLRNPWVNHFRHQAPSPMKPTCKRPFNNGEGYDARKRAASAGCWGGLLEGRSACTGGNSRKRTLHPGCNKRRRFTKAQFRHVR